MLLLRTISAVDVAAVAEAEDKDDDAVVFDPAHDPVITYPITPKTCVPAVEGMAESPWIFVNGDATAKKA